MSGSICYGICNRPCKQKCNQTLVEYTDRFFTKLNLATASRTVLGLIEASAMSGL